MIKKLKELAKHMYDVELSKIDSDVSLQKASSEILGKISTKLYEHLDFDTAFEIEGDIISFASSECEKYFILGFKRAIEIARMIKEDITIKTE